LAINKAFSGHNGPNYWINAELVMVDGRKMSRSLNNALPLSELRQKGYSGQDIRFFLMAVHYRKPINYSEETLNTAKNTVRKISTLIYRLNAVDHDRKNSFADTDQLIYDLKHGFMEHWMTI